MSSLKLSKNDKEKDVGITRYRDSKEVKEILTLLAKYTEQGGVKKSINNVVKFAVKELITDNKVIIEKLKKIEEERGIK